MLPEKQYHPEDATKKPPIKVVARRTLRCFRHGKAATKRTPDASTKTCHQRNLHCKGLKWKHSCLDDVARRAGYFRHTVESKSPWCCCRFGASAWTRLSMSLSVMFFQVKEFVLLARIKVAYAPIVNSKTCLFLFWNCIYIKGSLTSFQSYSISRLWARHIAKGLLPSARAGSEKWDSL